MKNKLSLGRQLLRLAGVAGLLLASLAAQAQTGAAYDWAWATRLGPSAGTSRSAYVNGLAADAAGNVTIGGEFDPDLYFANDPAVLRTNRLPAAQTSFTYTNGFLAQYRPDGQLAWTLNLDSQGGRVVDVATDAAGNLYALGYCNRGLSANASVLLANPGPRAFLLKLSAAGTVLWATDLVDASYGLTDERFTWKLAVDAGGNSVVLGTYRGSVTVGGQTYTSPSSVYVANPLLLRVSPTGQLAGSWAGQQTRGDNANRSYQGLALAPTGEVYVAGLVFDAELQLGSLPPVAGPVRATRGLPYLLKISATNQAEWLLVGNQPTPTTNGYISDVKVSPSGRIYAVGGMVGAFTLGTQAVPNPGGGNAFVLRLSPGGLIRRSATGTLSPYSLALGPADDLYIGTLVDAVQWGPVQLAAPASYQQQLSVVRLDSTGQGLQGWLAGGPAIARQPRLAVDGLGRATVATWLYGTGTFNFGTHPAASPDLWGMLVARTGQQVLAARPAPAVAGLQLYPNPARQWASLEVAVPGAVQVEMLDALGRLAASQALPGSGPLDLRGLAPGPYVVRVRQGQATSYRRLAVLP